MDRVDEILYLYEDDVEAPVDVLERLKATDPDKELRQKGLLPPLQQVEMADDGRTGFKDGLTVKQQQKIVEAFPGQEFNFDEYKYGVPKRKKPHQRTVINPEWTKIDRFKKKGFTTEMGKGLNTRGEPYQKEGKRLSIKDQNKIMAKYDLPEGVKEWDFSKPGQKYGFKQGEKHKNLVKRMAQTVADKKPWTLAADFGGAKGWMLAQMERVYKNEKKAPKTRPGVKKFTYTPIYEEINGVDRIIGFKDNTKAGGGKAYYGLNKYTKKGAGDWTKHGDWKLNNKLIDISKRSGNAPNDVITGLLKDRGFKNLDGKLKLNHLIHFLSGTKGTSKEMLKNAVVRHHNSGVAFGSATDDLSLTTQTINKKITGIEERIRANKILPDDIQTLKNNNVYVRHQGKLYGSGSKTAIGQFKQIESSVAKALDTGIDFAGNKFDNKKMLKFFKDAGIPCIKGEGGQCTSITDYQKGYNKLVQEAADGKGSAKAIQKLDKFTKGMRALTGAAKWTGYGLLAEAGFMVPFAIGDYAAGKSWKRIVGNATDYGFGPILGQSEQEEFEAALPKGSAAVQAEEVLRIGDEINRMEKQKVNPGYGRVGYRQKAEDARQNVYDDKFAEYVRNMQPFLRPSPHLEGGQFYDQELFNKAMTEGAEAREAIADREAKTKERRSAMDAFDEEIFQYKGYAGGGIASIRRPNAIPPESGPQPQGLENLKYYVTNT
jgi:hypothetical protein